MTQGRAIRVFGKVQGVFFRRTAREEAGRLGLSGFARNEPDGSVYVEIEGEDAALASFAAWCETGPPDARVERVEVTVREPVGYDRFVTR